MDEYFGVFAANCSGRARPARIKNSVERDESAGTGNLPVTRPIWIPAGNGRGCLPPQGVQLSWCPGRDSNPGLFLGFSEVKPELRVAILPQSRGKTRLTCRGRHARRIHHQTKNR